MLESIAIRHVFSGPAVYLAPVNRLGGWSTRRASKAARHLLAVIDRLTADANGRLFDWRGQSVLW